MRYNINVSNYIFHQRNKNSFKFGNEIYIMKYLKSSSIQKEFNKIFFSKSTLDGRDYQMRKRWNFSVGNHHPLLVKR